MTHEEICEEVQEEESLVVISDPSTTTVAKRKRNTAFNCFSICIICAEENGIFSKDIIVQNVQEKVFKQGLQVTQKHTSIKDYFKTD